MSLETFIKPIYRVAVKTGLIRIFVNSLTKRISLTTAYYLYKTGLIPHDPVNKDVITKTKIKVKIKPVIPGFIPLPAVDHLVPAGSLAQGKNAFMLPVVLFIDIDTPDKSKMIHHLAELQLVTFGFKPVILTNDPDFAAIRQYGYMFEYLPNRKLWSNLQLDMSYDKFVEDRKNEIIATHRPLRVINLSEIELLSKTYSLPS